MKKLLIMCVLAFFLFGKMNANYLLHNDYSYLQDITFELYTDDVPGYKIPEQLKSIEETLMFEVLHATWKDKHWVAYTLNKNLLGTYKVGLPALLDNGATKKIFFVAAFPGSLGGLDLYTAEYKNGSWSKPKNLGSPINTTANESNPGLLNDYTLTYSSDGIIKKLNLNTLKVVDLEEAVIPENKIPVAQNNTSNKQVVKNDKDVIAAIGDNSTAAPTGSTSPTTNDYGAIGDNSTAMPTATDKASNSAVYQKGATNDQIVLQEKTKSETQVAVKKQESYAETTAAKSVEKAPETSAVQNTVQSLGSQSRNAMIAKYKTAIQLGAFTTPKWEVIQPLSKYGQLVTYKNENGTNVVWLVGFANHAAAENVLPQIKSIAGFENAYITGK